MEGIAPQTRGGETFLDVTGFSGFTSYMKLIRLLMICAIGVLSVYAEESGFDSVDGPNVRVMRHDDGSRTIFVRSPDNRTLTKRTFSAKGTVNMVTIYRMDKNGNPTGCKIFDGNGSELYKFSYGYNKKNGKLAEERMFDSRVKRIDPKTGDEMPVRRFIYSYDALGNRSAPIAITLIKGVYAESFFGSPSALESDPFAAPRGR
jgi:hypothetical protein